MKQKIFSRFISKRIWIHCNERCSNFSLYFIFEYLCKQSILSPHNLFPRIPIYSNDRISIIRFAKLIIFAFIYQAASIRIVIRYTMFTRTFSFLRTLFVITDKLPSSVSLWIFNQITLDSCLCHTVWSRQFGNWTTFVSSTCLGGAQ